MKARIVMGVCCAIGLLMVFLTQRYDWATMMGFDFENIGKFIFNRSIRFILNDILAIGLIYALFREKKYIMFAIFVQVFGLLFVLIPYFIIKLNYPSYNGPLINFIHRLVLNPLLMLLLIPAFYFQKLQSHRDH